MFRVVIAAAMAVLLFTAAQAADFERQASLDATQGQYGVVAPIFTGSDNNTSFIRLFNTPGDASVTGPVTFAIKVVGSPSGTVYGTANVDVPLYAAPQYSISQILSQAGVAGLSGGDTGYALYIQGPTEGTGYAHVIYNGANGFFENASACEAYVQAPPDSQKWLFNVHTSRLSGYPSVIYVHNYAAVPLTYQATVRDARTGTKIGTLTLQVGANATTSIPFSSIEQQLGWTPDSTQLHANVLFEVQGSDTVPLVVTAFITNQTFNTSVNMTAICQAHGIADANGSGSSSTGGSGGSAPPYFVTVVKSGAGTGTVTSSNGEISCGATCRASLNQGTQLTLTAVAAQGSVFQSWSGCTSTTTTAGNLCNVEVNSTNPTKTVTATFGPNILTVTKAGTGTGTVTSSPAGIDCGSTCSAGFNGGQTVSLTAAPASGSTFQSWTGCSASGGTGNVCTVTMNGSKTVSANFSGPVTLSVSKAGSGTVTASAGGIDCGSTCSGNFTEGQTVSLTAAPASGWTFQSWTGCSTTTGNVCTVTMNGSKTVSATFSGPATLTVSKIGSGSVSSSTPGISCGGTCSAQFTSGQQVTLTATPASGLDRDFIGWSGCPNPSGTLCQVTISSNLTVTANFK